jgi:hypothetical protein
MKKKKLLGLKQWLTVADAARHLGILFGEDVSEADVLQLALGGHLTLSVNFVNHAYGRCGPVVPAQDAQSHIKFYPKSENEIEFVCAREGLTIDDDRVIDYDKQPIKLDGIWDLTMIGAERLDVEHRYQLLTGGPAVTLQCLAGPIVSRDDGTYCQVMTHYSSNEFANPKILKKPFDHPENFYPAAGLLPDSVLVVRTSSLRAFEARLSEPNEKVEKPIGQRERRTLLVIIAALCKLAKIDVAKPAAAGATIESQTIGMGARVPSRTIQEHLNRLPEALDARST